jgi:hypothetical protein
VPLESETELNVSQLYLCCNLTVLFPPVYDQRPGPHRRCRLDHSRHHRTLFLTSSPIPLPPPRTAPWFPGVAPPLPAPASSSRLQPPSSRPEGLHGIMTRLPVALLPPCSEPALTLLRPPGQSPPREQWGPGNPSHNRAILRRGSARALPQWLGRSWRVG